MLGTHDSGDKQVHHTCTRARTHTLTHTHTHTHTHLGVVVKHQRHRADSLEVNVLSFSVRGQLFAASGGVIVDAAVCVLFRSEKNSN